MSRIHLIHWNAEEAGKCADRLRRAGHDVNTQEPQGAAGLRGVLENPPDAFVIDLSRLPAQGRDLGILLRQRRAARLVPLVFVGGDAGKIARVRQVLPDAVYAEWSRIRGALRRTIQNPPVDPVVPGSMDGYSGTPLPKKLGIRAGSVVVLLGAPAGFERQLGSMPEGVRLHRRAPTVADLVLLFAKSRADLARRFPAAVRALEERGGVWIVWPKTASGVATDLTQPAVRAFGLRAGFVDHKICAVDETWSGLRFTRRRKRRSSGRAGSSGERGAIRRAR